MEVDDNQLKTKCQCCNGFVNFSNMSRELLYNNFINDIFYNLGLYPEELDKENLYFQWPAKNKM